MRVSNSIEFKKNWIPVIGHLRHSRVNHTPLHGVFLAVFLLFGKQIEYNLTFSHKKVFNNFLSSNFVIVTINYWASDRMRKKIKDYAEIFGHIVHKHALIMQKY